MKCSVVILNWNGAEMMRKYLPTVVKNTQIEGVEIVVADNGSEDDSLAVLARDFEGVRTIALGKNFGFAEGYNRAIEGIESEYVVLLNSDVAVEERWLEPLLDYMDKHKDVACAQPKIHADLKREAFEHAGAAGGYVDILGYPFCRGRIMGYVEQDRGQYDEVAEVLWTSGACMVVRTEVYKKEGGLDGKFFAHMEEIDLCWRLNSRGYRLVCVPESVVYHLGGGSLQYESPKKTYLNFRNNLLMLYKNLPTKRLWWVMMVRWALDYVAALQLLATGKAKNAKAAIEARWDYHKMKGEYTKIREENRRLATVELPKGIVARSILWDYYIRRKRQ